MTLRISGQVPFEDVKQIYDARETDEFGSWRDHHLGISQWALKRFGRHLKGCTFHPGIEEKPCVCGLEWAKEVIGCGR